MGFLDESIDLPPFVLFEPQIAIIILKRRCKVVSLIACELVSFIWYHIPYLYTLSDMTHTQSKMADIEVYWGRHGLLERRYEPQKYCRLLYKGLDIVWWDFTISSPILRKQIWCANLWLKKSKVDRSILLSKKPISFSYTLSSHTCVLFIFREARGNK